MYPCAARARRSSSPLLLYLARATAGCQKGSFVGETESWVGFGAVIVESTGPTPIPISAGRRLDHVVAFFVLSINRFRVKCHYVAVPSSWPRAGVRGGNSPASGAAATARTGERARMTFRRRRPRTPRRVRPRGGSHLRLASVTTPSSCRTELTGDDLYGISIPRCPRPHSPPLMPLVCVSARGEVALRRARRRRFGHSIRAWHRKVDGS